MSARFWEAWQRVVAGSLIVLAMTARLLSELICGYNQLRPTDTHGCRVIWALSGQRSMHRRRTQFEQGTAVSAADRTTNPRDRT